MKKILLFILTFLIILIVLAIIISINLIQNFGINNFKNSVIALYQIKINDVNYLEITENVYMVKNAEQAEKITYINNNENSTNFLSPTIFKVCKNRFLYSIVEYFQGTTGLLDSI